MLRVVLLIIAVNLFFPSLSKAQSTPAPLGVMATPNGSSLAMGESCYTITSQKDGKEQPMGYVFQSLISKQLDGVDILEVIVHQHLLDRKFDMRDNFLLRREDLRPIRLDTDRDGSPHVHLDYAANHVTGWKMVNGSKQPIDIQFDGPVWDGNLWGVTFAALPLKEGASYQLPTYQYDSGKGDFAITVTDQRKVDTPKGTVDAWVLKAGLKPDEQVEYLIGQSPPMELGYIAGPMSQHIGGNCAGLR